MLFSLSGCQKADKPEEVKIKDKKPELSFCEQSLKNGEDLNLNGCLYNEMPDGESVIFYLPQDSVTSETVGDDVEIAQVDTEALEAEGKEEWVFVVPFNSFIKPEDRNIDYIMDVLFTYLTGSKEKSAYQLRDNDETVVIAFNTDITDKFVKRHHVKVEEDGSYDFLGISQVMVQSIADTIYQTLPDLKVKFTINGLDKVADFMGLEEYVSRYSYLPYFFGSKNNYVGEYSYDDYVKQLAANGITLDAFSEDRHLLIVNNFLLISMAKEDNDNGYPHPELGSFDQPAEINQPEENVEFVQEVN